MMAKDALEECRLANHIDFVEDGVELLAYLRGQGRYAGLGPHEAGLDHARPEHAEDGRPRGACARSRPIRRCGGSRSW